MPCLSRNPVPPWKTGSRIRINAAAQHNNRGPKMRVVFMGSAEIACASLQTLLHTPGVEVVGIVTQPDRPAGRNRRLVSCPASSYAAQLGVKRYAPERVNATEALEHIQAWKPDIGVVVAYGQILKPALLAIPPLGFINVHTSLLPKYRGAAPIQWAVVNGDSETGVTIMQLDEGMDTGDILDQSRVPIGEWDTAGDVHDRLAVVGAALLPDVLARIAEGRHQPRPQEHAFATLAPKLNKADGRLFWNNPARMLYNQVRGLNPWPGCFCQYKCAGRVQTLRIMKSWAESVTGVSVPPGTVIDIHNGPLVACGEGALRLLQVQPEGGKVMEGTSFLCGRTLKAGECFL